MRHEFLRSDQALDGTNRDGDPASGARAWGAHADAELLAMIEREILPRMTLAHRAAASRETCEPAAPPSDEEIEAFAAVAVGGDLGAALRMVEAAYWRGVTVESLLMDLIAPAARRLGRDWEADRRSFAEVTAGTDLLEQVVNVLAARFSKPPFDRG